MSIQFAVVVVIVIVLLFYLIFFIIILGHTRATCFEMTEKVTGKKKLKGKIGAPNGSMIAAS